MVSDHDGDGHVGGSQSAEDAAGTETTETLNTQLGQRPGTAGDGCVTTQVSM